MNIHNNNLIFELITGIRFNFINHLIVHIFLRALVASRVSSHLHYDIMLLMNTTVMKVTFYRNPTQKNKK